MSPELGIGGLVNLSHAPLADEGGDVVVAESGADIESHKPERIYRRRAAESYLGGQRFPLPICSNRTAPDQAGGTLRNSHLVATGLGRLALR